MYYKNVLNTPVVYGIFLFFILYLDLLPIKVDANGCEGGSSRTIFLWRIGSLYNCTYKIKLN